MQLAVERKAPTSYAGDRGVFLPEERLDLIDALAGFTCSAAYVNHLDDQTGTLEVGKLADYTVLDRDLFDRGAGAIGEARVIGTYIEGAAVYEDAALDG
jgi:predicted amidohydrolase YtcJ